MTKSRRSCSSSWLSALRGLLFLLHSQLGNFCFNSFCLLFQPCLLSFQILYFFLKMKGSVLILNSFGVYWLQCSMFRISSFWWISSLMFLLLLSFPSCHCFETVEARKPLEFGLRVCFVHDIITDDPTHITHNKLTWMQHKNKTGLLLVVNTAYYFHTELSSTIN